MEIKKVGIIGAGVMGTGIAQIILLTGIKVYITDIDPNLLEKSKNLINRTLRKIIKTEEPNLLINNLVTCLDLDSCINNADLVIEAVSENMEVKKKIFSEIGKKISSSTILASNTSTMNISLLGSHSGRPENTLGIHFFNPPYFMKLIEIIPGEKTNPAILPELQKWCESLPCKSKKRLVPILNKDTPGFLANRIFAPSLIYMDYIYNQCIENNISWDALNWATKSKDYPMGYPELIDYIGHDIIMNMMVYYSKTLSDDFTPSNFYFDFVKKRQYLGRKSNQGFFKWVHNKPVIADFSKVEKCTLISIEELKALEANEGCRILDERIVDDVSIIDEIIEAAYNRPGVMEEAKHKYKLWTKILTALSEKTGKDYLKPCSSFINGVYFK